MTLDAPDPVAETPDVGGDRSPLLVDLEARGLISDSTDLAVLGRRLNAGPITLYCGFDPTGPSLHAGHLQQLMLLGRIARAGHRPLVLVGGATGRIGDPSGRDSERPLLDDATLAANIASIREQVGRFIRFDGDPPGDDAVDDDGPVVGGGRLVDNHDWTGPLSLLDFLRDVGKHVTIGTMLARDSVRSRIDRSDGMSFTEFSYQLLQAYDFVHLHRAYDCELQVAGSDQWGNITAGIDLARRLDGATLHGLTSPLVVRSDGKKFGKSTGGAIWLSAEHTSPYAFYQYWMQVPDDDVEPMLLRLTFLSVEAIAEVVDAHRREPHRREGQRTLAHDLTTTVHGAAAAAAAAAASEVLFGGDPAGLDRASLDMLAGELPTLEVTDGELADGIEPADAFVRSGLAKSKGEVRKNAGGFRLNGVAVDLDEAFGAADLLVGRAAVLSHGKRRHALLVRAENP